MWSEMREGVRRQVKAGRAPVETVNYWVRRQQNIHTSVLFGTKVGCWSDGD